MNIFGTWLPFVGIRTIDVDNNGEPTDVAFCNLEADCFQIEWLGVGITICTWNARAKEK